MSYECCVCGSRVISPTRYFCWHCYGLYGDDIRNKKEWTRFLVNTESKRRRDERKWSGKLVFLSDDYDLSDEKKLIRTNYDKEN